MVEELLHSFCCSECNRLFAIGCVKGCSKHVSSVVAAAKYCNLTPCRFHPFSKHPSCRQINVNILLCDALWLADLDFEFFSVYFDESRLALDSLSGAEATPPSRLFPQFRVRHRGVTATRPPPPKGPYRTPSQTPLQWGLADGLDLRNPVALQGVEQLHLRVSRYTLTLTLIFLSLMFR